MSNTIICDVIILILLEIFILSYLNPSLIIKDTTITGGDTASFFYPLKYLKETLLPGGRLIGWDPGNFAGYPLFQFYFVIPFLLAAIIGYFIKLTVALKIVTILGILTLPVFTYSSFRKLNYSFPTPVIAATFSLIFLFMQGYSIWGGNILSTLAGEFCYGISLSVFVLYIGHLYRGILDNKGLVKNAILLALCGLCHSFVFVIAGTLSFFFLFSGVVANLKLRKTLHLNRRGTQTKACSYRTDEYHTNDRVEFVSRLKYVIKLNLLAFLLMGFWIIPFITKIEYTTPFYLIWLFVSLKEILSPTLIPFLILSIIRVSIPKRFLKNDDRKRCAFFLYICFVAIMMYCNAHIHHAPDIRFLPVLYLMLIFITADLVGCIVYYIKPRIIFSIMVLFGITFWIYYQGSYAKSWTKWNYEGYEAKATWKTFEKINSFLKGDVSNPRVAYEKSNMHSSFGSDRVFESIPLFSGRQTLEGIHFASSISSKPIIFLQTELSKDILAPIQYIFSKVNIEALRKHLKIFNINHLIVVTDKTKVSLRKNAGFKEVFKLKNYSIFEFTENTGNYVEIPKYLPVVYTGKDWREQFYEWFKIPETLDVPLIPSSHITSNDLKDFRSFTDDIRDIKRFMADNLLSIDTPNPSRSALWKIPLTPFDKGGNIENPTLIKGENIENPTLLKERNIESPPLLKGGRGDLLQGGIEGATGITETITPFEIKFVTPYKGIPHIIKVSYFPNWKVSGADRIYPVSPSFMLVIPNQNEVTLTYGRTPFDILGIILTLAGFIICIATMCGVWKRATWIHPVESGFVQWRRHPCLRTNSQYPKFWDFVYKAVRPCILAAVILLLIMSTTYSMKYRNYPVNTYRKGMYFYGKGKYEDAIRTFQMITRDKKYDVLDVILSMLFEARSYSNMKRFDNAIKTLQDIIDTYPYSRYTAEAYYEIGLVYMQQNDTESAKTAFKKAINDDKYSTYAWYAKGKLEELTRGFSTSLIYSKGVNLFNEGKYAEAAEVLKKITSTNAYEEPEYPHSLLIEAKCYTYLNDNDKAMKNIQKVLANYKDSTYIPECYYEMGLIYLTKNKKGEAKEMFKKAVETYSLSHYVTLARDRLKELEGEY